MYGVCVYRCDSKAEECVSVGFASVWVRAIMCDDQGPTIVVERHLLSGCSLNERPGSARSTVAFFNFHKYCSDI